MMMAEQPKTTAKAQPAAKRATTTVTSAGSTSAPVATGVPAQTASTSAPASAPQTQTPAAPAIAKPSPRNGVRVNVTSIQVAFTTGGSARSVKAIQYALRDRGFTPGNYNGLVDPDTRAAYAQFQRDINERATGVPTDDSLDILGFDIVG